MNARMKRVMSGMKTESVISRQTHMESKVDIRFISIFREVTLTVCRKDIDGGY